MNKFFILFLLVLISSGCEVKLKSDPIEVDGEVRHVVTVDTTQLVDFYTLYCENKFEDQNDVDKCVNESLAAFWQALDQSTSQGQVQEE